MSYDSLVPGGREGSSPSLPLSLAESVRSFGLLSIDCLESLYLRMRNQSPEREPGRAKACASGSIAWDVGRCSLLLKEDPGA